MSSRRRLGILALPLLDGIHWVDSAVYGVKRCCVCAWDIQGRHLYALCGHPGCYSNASHGVAW